MNIGVFDSGVGGLTVVKELLRYLSGSEDRLIYFGDTARVPYGTKSRETVVKFSREIVSFLLQFNVDEIVIACHTASSFALDVLNEEISIPVRGVIKPGIKEAVSITKTGKIGVIGTSSTISSRSYNMQLQTIAPEIEIISESCPLFVPLAEEGWLQDPVTEAVAHRYLDSFAGSGVDVIILGCTHYPLLKLVIQKVVGESITVVDSACAVAKDLGDYYSLECDMSDDFTDKSARCDFFVSDEEERFKKVGGRFLGINMNKVKKVDLNKQVLEDIR